MKKTKRTNMSKFCINLFTTLGELYCIKQSNPFNEEIERVHDEIKHLVDKYVDAEIESKAFIDDRKISFLYNIRYKIDIFNYRARAISLINTKMGYLRYLERVANS